MRPRVVEGEVCQCGRDIVMLAPSLKVCQGCAYDAPFCTCHAVGLVAPKDAAGLLNDPEGILRLLEDMRAPS